MRQLVRIETRLYATLTPMGDVSRTISASNQPFRPTQPPILRGTGNNWQAKCDDALRQALLISIRGARVDGRKNCAIRLKRAL